MTSVEGERESRRKVVSRSKCLCGLNVYQSLHVSTNGASNTQTYKSTETDEGRDDDTEEETDEDDKNREPDVYGRRDIFGTIRGFHSFG